MPNPLFSYFEQPRTERKAEQYLYHPALGKVKQYVAANRLPLPVPQPLPVPISSLLAARRSHRSFIDGVTTVTNLATILYWSMSQQASCNQEVNSDFVRRPYPSGGAKFPIELYILADAARGAELPSGVYHYRPDTHEIEEVQLLSDDAIHEIKASYVYAFVKDIPVLCIMSYIRERNMPKYSYFGEKIALIEAGHIGQNITLLAPAVGLGAISLAGGQYEMFDRYFGLDSYNESTFYTIGLGPIATKEAITR